MSFLKRFPPLRFLERTFLLVLLAVAGVTWTFIELADEVQEGDSRRFDEWALRSLRHPDNLSQPIGPVWLEDFARDITALGGAAVIGLVALTTIGFLALQRKKHAAVLVAAAIFGGALLTAGLKEFFARERPALVPHLAHVTSSSFPSGHSTLSAVTYLTLAALLARTVADRGTRAYLLGIASVLVMLIGLSRIFLGVHYPTDVLAGWCAGIAWALVCAVFTRWLQRRGQVETAGPEPMPVESPE